MSGIKCNEFEIKDGLRLSLLLFIISIDKIIKCGNAKIKKVTTCYHHLQPVTVTDCAFANDLALFRATEK